VSTKPLNELIAERAYEVYQRRERSGAPGDQHSDWAQAEKEVTEELKKKDAAKPVPVSAPKVEIKPVAKPELKEPPKPAAPKAEEKAPAKVEPKPAAPAVKTVVAKKTAKK
jgi:hypothetical protein